MHKNDNPKAVVLVSADAEWQVIREIFPFAKSKSSPFGEWFPTDLPGQATFFRGGWGKIAAAASTQFVIDHWKPDLLVNLGTCGGFEGMVEKDEILLVEKTVVYDLLEQMSDQDSHLDHYTTELDLSWLVEPTPQPVRRAVLASGDRDLLPQDIPWLKQRFNALAGDWESGAIAWVARRNQKRLLILRGVTDIVGASGSAAYGNLAYYRSAADQIMRKLVGDLPRWLEIALEPGDRIA